MRAEYAWLLPPIPPAISFLLPLFGRSSPAKGHCLGVLATATPLVLFLFVLSNFLPRGPAAWPITADFKWSTIPGAVGQSGIEVGGFHLRMGIFVDQMTILMLG